MSNADSVVLSYSGESTYGQEQLASPAVTTAASNIGVAPNAGLTRFTRAGGSWQADGFLAGMHVVASGYTGGSAALVNNIPLQVVTVASLTMDCTPNLGATIAAGDSVTFTGKVFIRIRLTRDSIRPNIGTTRSAEIGQGRQINDFIRNSYEVQGDVEGEMSFGTYDEWIQWTFQSPGWSTPVVFTGTNLGVQHNTAGDEITLTRGAGDWAADGFVVGGWIQLSGATNPLLNRIYRTKSIPAATLLLADSWLGVEVDEVAGASMTVEQGAQIVNASTFKSMNLARDYDDLTNVMAMHTGVTPGSFDLNVRANEVVGVRFGMLGSRELSKTLSVPGAGYVSTTPSTTGVMNAIDHVEAIVLNTAYQAVKVDCPQEMTLRFNNNLRGRACIGVLGAGSIGSGTFEVTGTFRKYFESHALYDYWLNFGTFKAAVIMKGPGGAGYVFDLPSCKFSAGERPTPGQNQDVTVNMQIAAFKDATQGITARAVRFQA